MQSVVVRRIAVLVACALGGAVLYLAPEPTGNANSELLDVPASVPAAAASTMGRTGDGGPSSRTPSAQPSPSLHQDRTLPTPVRRIHLASNTAQTYTIAWSPSYDAAGIRHYVVLANGFLVARVTTPSVTLAWPTTSNNILVQVAPVDGNGLQGEWRALMVIPPPLTPWTQATTSTPKASTSEVDPRSPLPSPSGTPSVVVSSPPPSPSPSPSPAQTSPDPCSTSDVTPTATATQSPPFSAEPTASLSPSASASPSTTPSTSLSTEPGISATPSPTPSPSC